MSASATIEIAQRINRGALVFAASSEDVLGGMIRNLISCTCTGCYIARYEGGGSPAQCAAAEAWEISVSQGN